MAMDGLFQDEPDEDSPAGLFDEEPNEDAKLFMDALEEAPTSSRPAAANSAAPRPLGQEQDEREPQLFGIEFDESDSGNSAESDVGYHGDCEEVPEGSKSIVELSFSTISQFLATQLAVGSGVSSTASAQPSKKRRCYDNSRRELKALQRKKHLPHTVEKRARNHSVPWLTTMVLPDIERITTCRGRFWGGR